LIQYPSTANYDTIASSCVNPLTVCGFVDTCIKNKVTAVIQDAAASALGKQFIRLARVHGIHIINIV